MFYLCGKENGKDKGKRFWGINWGTEVRQERELGQAIIVKSERMDHLMDRKEVDPIIMWIRVK